MPYKDKRKNQDCKNASFRRYYKANREDMIDRVRRTRLTEHGLELHRKSSTRCRLRNPEKSIYYGAKSRAKKRGIEFTIAVEDVIIPDVCPVLGIPIVFRVGQKVFQPDSPSLDRIQPRKGYVPGNVAVISWRANKLKSDATLEELKALTCWMEEKCL